MQFRVRQLILAAIASGVSALLFGQHGPSPAERAAEFLRQHDPAAAAAVLAPLLKAHTTDASVHYEMGNVHLHERQVAEAAACYRRAAELDPAKPAYFSQLGMALSVLTNELSGTALAQAVAEMGAAFRRSLELNPKHIPGLMGMIRFHGGFPAELGGDEAAAAEFAARLASRVPFLAAHELGWAEERKGNHAAALAHYEHALAANAKHTASLTGAGRMLLKLGRPDEARQRLEAALALDPHFSEAKQALDKLMSKKDD